MRRRFGVGTGVHSADGSRRSITVCCNQLRSRLAVSSPHPDVRELTVSSNARTRTRDRVSVSPHADTQIQCDHTGTARARCSADTSPLTAKGRGPPEWPHHRLHRPVPTVHAACNWASSAEGILRTRLVRRSLQGCPGGSIDQRHSSGEGTDVLLVVGAYPPPVHGASRVAQGIVEACVARGIPTRVISTSATGAGVPYHLRRASKYLAAMGWIISHSRHDRVVVYQTGAGGAGLYYQATLALVCRIVGVRHCFHHHSFAYINSYARRMAVLSMAAGPRSQHIALCSQMADGLRRMYGCRSVEVFSNAMVLGGVEVGYRRDRRPFVVGHLSNLSLEKGVAVVIAAVDILRREGHDVLLRLAGPASDSETRRHINDHMHGPAVPDKWLGRLPQDDVPRFMRDLDCFVFPSSYQNEALPLVVLEALRQGTPTVATRVGCLDRLLKATGWTSEPDAQSVAATIRGVMFQEDARGIAASVYEREFEDRTVDEFLKVVLQQW